MAGIKKSAVAAPAAPAVGVRERLRYALTGKRAAVAALVVLAAAAAGAYGVWTKVKGGVLSGNDYRLSPHDIEITPQPAWIRADVKTEAIRSASLASSLSILDDDLTVKVAQAFGLHPWVAKVERVYKEHPARVVAELTYREPVAMVEVQDNGQQALLPVDVSGVVLPSQDFAPAEARAYPRISGIVTSPLRPVGEPWGDPHVVGAAQIAAALKRQWRSLKLVEIAPATGQGVHNPADAQYELITRHGTRISWGRAPGAAGRGESAAADKLARLVQFQAKHGSLDPADEQAAALDLRPAADASAPPRKIVPLPEQEPDAKAEGGRRKAESVRDPERLHSGEP